uniref:G domain-containing protein n=1 Tax=Meloidogyne hapla TaxID=6305 RepID=A0A1I8BCJ7_MELHA
MPLYLKLLCSHGISTFILLPKSTTNLFIRLNQSTLPPIMTAKYRRDSLLRELNRRYERLQNFKKKTNKLTKNKEILPKIESIAAQEILSSDRERVESINERARNVYKEEFIVKNQRRNEQEILPYNIQQNPDLFVNRVNELEESSKEFNKAVKEDKNDVGFFVADNKFCDDYAIATTADLPEDEMTEPEISYYGNVNEAVENIEFQLPLQSPLPKAKNISSEEKLESGEWLSNYGTTEVKEEELKNIKMLDSKCESCGAQFHCHNSSLPGFVPLELLNEIEKNSKKIPFYQKTGYVCRRCFLLKEYNFLLNVNVCELDYNAMMSHLKLFQEALILLIVDLTDLHSSIHRDLPRIIGPKKPLIVVGNKVDLLPPDTRTGYLRHYQNCLKNAISEAGIAQNFNILKYMLISAKTGFGIEEMITNIYQNWIGPRGVLRGDIYVIGSTNAGKSTTSIWPGTTLSLLKFPLMNPTPQRMEMRRKRLIDLQAWRSKEEYVRKAFYERTFDTKYAVLQGIVENTFKAKEQNLQPVATSKIIKQFNSEIDANSVEELIKENDKKPNMTLNDRVFDKGFWCFDTPGTVNKQQILDLFTLKELINIIPRSIILPRVFILYPNESLLLGGVGRIDLLGDSSIIRNLPIFLTVFASEHLKVNIMKTKYVDTFFQRNRGNPLLGAPIGNNERLNKFPKLEYKDFLIENDYYLEDDERGIADVVLSSLGWVLLTTKMNSINIRAWTPSGRGLITRQPPILPYAAAYRGRKIFGTSAFQTRKLADIETFSHTQRSVKPGKIIGENYEIDSSAGEPYRFVNFDIV